MKKKKELNKKTKTTSKKTTSKKTTSAVVKNTKAKSTTTNKKTKKKKRFTAFTLIELLAVIIILGILMIIAIPSVTKYISDSRDSAYIDTAKEIVTGARNMVNAGNLEVFNSEVTYYIPYSCIGTENGSTSPYGEWKDAYVVFTYDGKGYDYYWTSIDETKQGIYLTSLELLDTDKMIRSAEDINTNIAISGHNKISILDKETCSVFSEPSDSVYQIPQSSSLTEEQYEEANQFITFYVNDKSYSVQKNKTWLELVTTNRIGDHKATIIDGVSHDYKFTSNKPGVGFCIPGENNSYVANIYMARNGITGALTGGSWDGYCIQTINNEIGIYQWYTPVVYYNGVMTEGEFTGITHVCAETILDSSNTSLNRDSKPIANEHYHTNHECDGFTLTELNFTS